MHGKPDEQARHTLHFLHTQRQSCPRTGQIGRDVGGPHTQMYVCSCENVCHFVNTQREHSFNTASKRNQNVCVSISLHNGHI